MPKPRACRHADPPCRPCIGRRNRSRGKAKQRIVFKLLAFDDSYIGNGAEEERWGESPYFPGLSWECKSGKLPAFITKAIAQAERSGKPGAVALVPEGSQAPYLLIPAVPLIDILKGRK